jgi:hypothetical protein
MTRRIALSVLTLVIAAVALFAGTGPASATETDVVAEKGKCLTEPTPASPNDGLLGILSKPPAEGEDIAGSGDPWDEKNPSNMIDVYGFNVKFFTYDTGCFPGSGMVPDLQRSFDNFGMSVLLFFEQAAYTFISFTLSPGDWLGDFDTTVATLSSIVKEGVFTPWIAVGLLVAGGIALWFAAKGRISRTATGVIWAIAVLGISATMLDYPTKVTDIFDGAMNDAVSIIAGANASDNETAEEAVDEQFEEIHRRTMYDQWLAANFGDPDSKAAEDYGPRLFKATHLTFDEAKTLDGDDEDKRKELLDQKKDDFKSVTDDINDNYPYIYDSKIKGAQLRLGNTFGAGISLFAALGFTILAGIWVLLSFILIRIFVVLAPIGAPIGVLEAARAFVLKFGSKFGLFLIVGPMFFIAALLNMRIATAMLRADLPMFVKLLILVVVTIILWKLFKPISGPAGEMLKSSGRKVAGLAGLRMLTKKRREFRSDKYREDGSKRTRAERKVARRDRKVAHKVAATEARDRLAADRYANSEGRKVRRSNRLKNLGERAAAGYGKKIPLPGAGGVFNRAAKVKRQRRKENEQNVRDAARAQYMAERGYKGYDSEATKAADRQRASRRRYGHEAADVVKGAAASWGAGGGPAAQTSKAKPGAKTKPAGKKAAGSTGMPTPPASPAETQRKATASSPTAQTPQNAVKRPGVSKWGEPATQRPFASKQARNIAKRTGQAQGEREKFRLSEDRKARVGAGAKTRAAARPGQ